MYKIILEVVQVPQKCAANYKVSDKIVVDDANIDLKESTDVCLYALGSLMPYLTARALRDPRLSSSTSLIIQNKTL